MKKRTTLTLKNLTELFAVTAPTIYAWQSKLMLPPLVKATPHAIKRWAKDTGTSMTCEPSTLLGKDILKPGPKVQVTAADVHADKKEVKEWNQRMKRGYKALVNATTSRPARSAATKTVAKRKAVA